MKQKGKKKKKESREHVRVRNFNGLYVIVMHGIILKNKIEKNIIVDSTLPF